MLIHTEYQRRLSSSLFFIIVLTIVMMTVVTMIIRIQILILINNETDYHRLLVSLRPSLMSKETAE